MDLLLLKQFSFGAFTYLERLLVIQALIDGLLAIGAT